MEPCESFDITIYQGADYSDSFLLQNASSVAIDLTDSVITSELRRGPAGENYPVIASFVISTPTPTTGQIDRALSGVITASLPLGQKLFYDVKIVLSNGSIIYPIRGSVAIEPSITL